MKPWLWQQLKLFLYSNSLVGLGNCLALCLQNLAYMNTKTKQSINIGIDTGECLLDIDIRLLDIYFTVSVAATKLKVLLSSTSPLLSLYSELFPKLNPISCSDLLLK